MKNLAIFDLDGTLINASSERRFVHFLFSQKILGFKQYLSFLSFIPKHFFQYKEHVFKKNKAYLNGLSVETIETLANEFVEKHLDESLYCKVTARLKEHAHEGETLILLTGTLECLAKAIAKTLDFDEHYATECMIEDHCYTNTPPTQHPFGDSKLAIAQKLCDKHNTQLNHVTAYGDAIYDFALLDAAGKAIAVYPKPALRKIAEERNWEIIDDNQVEVMPVF